MRAIGHMIYSKRRALGLTQAALALKTSIPQPNLSNIEKGKQDITVSTLRRISCALEMDLGDFFRNDKRSLKSQGLVFSRERTERLVKAVRGYEVPLKSSERKLVELLKQVMPRQNRKFQPARKLYHTWTQLRSGLAPVELKMLIERVRETKVKLK
jgi:transcriptional regulator with XRE-family HTH domain